MTLFRFSSSTVDDSEVGSIRRNLRRSVCVCVDMAIPDISYTRYIPSDLFTLVEQYKYTTLANALISFAFSIHHHIATIIVLSPISYPLRFW